MATLEEDEKLLLAGAAYRLALWGGSIGALLLTDKRLVFESSPWGRGEGGVLGTMYRDGAFPLQSISDARRSSRLAVPFRFVLWPARFLSNPWRANLAVTSNGKDYDFRIRDPEMWIQRIEAAAQAAKRSW